MRKAFLSGFAIFFCAAITAGGCAQQDTPKNTVLRFLKAVRGANAAEIENTLSFERLIEQREGEAYMKLSTNDRSVALERFKNNMMRQLTTGNLKSLGEIEAVIEKENVQVENAEVAVVDSKNGKRYQFSLVREGGAWKIYSISGQ